VIKSLQRQVATLRKAAKDAEGKLETYQDSGYVETLQGKVRVLEARVEELEAEKKALEKFQRIKDKALVKYESDKDHGPLAVKRFEEEIRALKHKVASQQETCVELEKTVRAKSELIDKHARLFNAVSDELFQKSKMGGPDFVEDDISLVVKTFMSYDRDVGRLTEAVTAKDLVIQEKARLIEALEKKYSVLEHARESDARLQRVELQKLTASLQEERARLQEREDLFNEREKELRFAVATLKNKVRALEQGMETMVSVSVSSHVQVENPVTPAVAPRRAEPAIAHSIPTSAPHHHGQPHGQPQPLPQHQHQVQAQAQVRPATAPAMSSPQSSPPHEPSRAAEIVAQLRSTPQAKQASKIPVRKPKAGEPVSPGPSISPSPSPQQAPQQQQQQPQAPQPQALQQPQQAPQLQHPGRTSSPTPFQHSMVDPVAMAQSHVGMFDRPSMPRSREQSPQRSSSPGRMTIVHGPGTSTSIDASIVSLVTSSPNHSSPHHQSHYSPPVSSPPYVPPSFNAVQHQQYIRTQPQVRPAMPGPAATAASQPSPFGRRGLPPAHLHPQQQQQQNPAQGQWGGPGYPFF
jgi:hypothetical protein